MEHRIHPVALVAEEFVPGQSVKSPNVVKEGLVTATSPAFLGFEVLPAVVPAQRSVGCLSTCSMDLVSLKDSENRVIFAFASAL